MITQEMKWSGQENKVTDMITQCLYIYIWMSFLIRSNFRLNESPSNLCAIRRLEK